jgi:hypothetical protein
MYPIRSLVGIEALTMTEPGKINNDWARAAGKLATDRRKFSEGSNTLMRPFAMSAM